MHNQQSAVVTFEVVVECQNSEWIPYRYRMTWCKQKNIGLHDWIEGAVECFPFFGHLLGVKRMQVGDKWHFRVTAHLSGYQDYWSEWEEDLEVLKCKCFKKYRRVK